MLSEPNYGVNLELAELINEKKANTSVPFRVLLPVKPKDEVLIGATEQLRRPRDGAMEVVRAINNRNPHIAMLALHVRFPTHPHKTLHNPL